MFRQIIFLVFIGIFSAKSNAEMEVEFVGSYSETGYVNRLLSLVLDATTDEYGGWKIGTKPPASDLREITLVTSRPEINRLAITARPHEIQEKPNLRMLHVPLMRGSFGYRVCVTASEFDETLTTIFNSGDLQNLRFGVGYEWSDTEILRNNGLNAVEAGYDLVLENAITSLYKMAAHRRVDVFCRGIVEILQERDHFESNASLVLNQSHVIVYNMPFFFYLHADNIELYERLKVGFERVKENGAWEVLWLSSFENSLRYTHLEGRKVIRLQSEEAFYDSEEYRSYLFF